MDKKSNEEKEARFSEIMQQPPYPVDEVLGLIAEAVPESIRDALKTEDSQLKAKFMRVLHGQTQLVSLFR